MPQDFDKIGFDFVDLPDDFVRIREITLFVEKSIKEVQRRRPENIFRRGGHHFTDEKIFRKFLPVPICNRS
jgi:hypothetical protein